jgi:hypothetical protein
MENTKIQTKYKCVLPHEDVKKFLIDVIEQSNFKGSMVEFVSTVKQILVDAEISITDVDK